MSIFFFNKILKVNVLYNRLLETKAKGEMDSILRALSANYVVENTKVLFSEKEIKYDKNIRYDGEGSYFSLIAGYVFVRGEKEMGVLPLFCVKSFFLKLLLPYTELSKYPINQQIIDQALGHSHATRNLKLKKEVKEEIATALTHGGGRVIDCVVGKKPINAVPPRVCLEEKDIHRLCYDSMPVLSVEEIGFYRKVKTGQKIGTWVAATKGADGKDIYGKEVLFDHFDFPEDDPIGEGLKKRGAEIFCEKNGFLRIGFQGVLSVRDVEIIDGDIQKNYFNEDPQKDLIVNGSIFSQTQIVTKGAVYVLGNVERAKVIAGGDIIVAGGIMAGAYVDSKKNVEAEFVLQATVLANGGVKIKKNLFSSFVYSQSWLLVLDKESGVISGSHICVESFVRAPIIGSNSSSAMCLEVTRRAGKIVEEKRQNFYAEFFQLMDKEIKKLEVWLGTKYLNDKEGYIKSLSDDHRKWVFLDKVSTYDLLNALQEYFGQSIKKIENEKFVSLSITKKDLFVLVLLSISTDVRVQMGNKEFVVATNMKGPLRLRYLIKSQRIVLEQL